MTMTKQDFIQEFNLTPRQAKAELIALLANQTTWETRFRQLMLLGKSLPIFPLQWQRDDYLVQGCESKVWLLHHWQDGKLQLAASSEAKIIKGLLYLVLEAFHDKRQEEIMALDFEAYFQQLKLTGQLSPSRTNGIHAIVEQIRNLAN